MIVHKNQLAEVFRVSLVTVGNWLNAGCPHKKDGKNYQFETATVSEWLIQREVAAAAKKVESKGVDEFSKRKAAAEAGLVELKLAEKQKALIALSDVEGVWETIVSNTRKKLEPIAASVAGAVHAAETAADVEGIIRAALYEALEELSGSANAIFGVELPDHATAETHNINDADRG